MSRLFACLFLSLACAASALADDGPAAVLARARAASGGPRWDGVASWRGEGTLATGGLRGNLHALVDLHGGRSVNAYTLGSVDGADGYDGTHAWERDPGGEVAVLDAPEAVRRARTQAWLDARAYWFPARMDASYGPVEERAEGGVRHRVLVANPRDGSPVTLWFGADGLLARSVQQQGQDTATTAYADYREVDGVRLPFHIVTDFSDAAGRTDARRRVEVQLDAIVLNAPVEDGQFAMPAMQPAARIATADGVARIGFRLANNHIYVDGAVDGKPAQFLVDTGGFNLLTPAAAQRVGLQADGQLSAGGTGEQRADVALARARLVTVGPVALQRPVFYVVDLGQLAQVEGVAVDGLVGYEMFRRFGVAIDYAARELTISAPETFVPPHGAVAIPFELDDHFPIVAGTLDGIPARISIDTGSRASLTLHAPFVRAHDLVARYRANTDSVTGWGVGGAQRGHPARLGTLQLGGLEIRGVAGDLFTGDKGSFANPEIDANLGGGVLRRFTVAFDYANRRIYLKPNAAFAHADAFDRSGLWLLADGDALKVADVAVASAAGRAGLQADDRLLAIGGEPAGRRTLSDWRALLAHAPAGTKLALRIERGGEKRSAELVLSDRIPAASD